MALFVMGAACSSQAVGTGGTHQSASPTSATSTQDAGKQLLFAVLEPGGDLTSVVDSSVAIVRTDGTAQAKAHFNPRTLPKIGNALPLPQPEARVAAGKVYFVDGAGAVRSLANDGTVASITSFPITNTQQELSFSVSPDGTQLIGAVFGFPPVHSPPPQNAIDPPFGPGDFTAQVWSAKPGQQATSLQKRSWPQSGGLPKDALEVVGWSQEAPLATTDSELFTQQGSLGRETFGHVAELDTLGRPGPPIGGYTCQVWSVLADETVLCDEDGQMRNFAVRSRDGTLRFRLSATGEAEYIDMSLAPDAKHVAYLEAGNRAAVVDSAGKATQLPATFRPTGWLTANLIIGDMVSSVGDGDMAVVRLDQPTRMTDLGFKGRFVGIVQS